MWQCWDQEEPVNPESKMKNEDQVLDFSEEVDAAGMPNTSAGDGKDIKLWVK